MTCIVAATDGRSLLFGADSAGPSGDEILVVETPKVFARGLYLIGYAGSFRLGQILRYTADLPDPPEASDLEAFLVRELVPAVRKAVVDEGMANPGPRILGEQVSFLLGCRGQIWTVTADLSVIRETPFAAAGSGRLRAYGALHALHAAGVEPVRRRLELALEAAAAYTTSVRPPWLFVSSDQGP